MLMAVGLAGPLAGSVGGGKAEAALVDAAVGRLRSGDFRPWRQTLIHHPAALNASGMLCGGEQQVAVACWQPGQAVPVPGEAWSIAGDGWQYQAPLAAPVTVYLVGGGHVSLALSQLLAGLDFHVSVLEERAGISTFSSNRWAHAKRSCPYEQLAEYIPAGAAVFVGIMTHAHERDAVAWQALAGRRYGYLGLLGSRHKLAKLLAGENLPDFAHAPMGLPIGSHTPAEIAVSIAAEMVASRNAAVDGR